MLLFVISILVVIASLLLAVYLTNPFNLLTIIKQPFVVTNLTNAKVINQLDKLRVHQNFTWRWFAIAKCGLHILHTRYISSPRSSATTVQGIVADIHARRFRPDKLLLISGDHFSGLFVRNLGVFYYPTLDARIPGDWQNRQVVYLQTVAYALGVFAKRPIPTTTIVETGKYSATPVNFYAYPSDTVYGILYALAALSGIETAAPTDYGRPVQILETQKVAHDLRHKFATTLQKLYEHYRHTVFDEAAGLIDSTIHISGAKDITRRQSSFYDNVIFWKTTQLAMRLGVIPNDQHFLKQLKQRILQTFWLEDRGYFLEDLSSEGKAEQYYSSDWLIVLATGFLNLSNKKERPYFERSIAYIREKKIDQPFPLKYHSDTRAHRQFLAVRLAVASYGGDAIWSFWGMEYIKVLLLLSGIDNSKDYLQLADTHIKAYERAMLENGGFPETYDSTGKLLQTLFYRSIRQTGWVIGFEQARTMRDTIGNHG